MTGGGDPFLPEIFSQTDRVGAESPVFDLHCVSKNIPDVFSYNSRKH